MKNLINLLAVLLFTSTGGVDASNLTKQSLSCYSAYQLEQDLTMSLRFGDTTQMKNIDLEMEVHVRSIENSRELFSTASQLDEMAHENVRSYVFFLKPSENTIEGHSKSLADKYQHPFLVTVDHHSGELIEIKSTSPDKAMLKEYLGYFDLFQYSQDTGSFRYRNGNGYYQAQVNNIVGTDHTLEKSNEGYLNNDQLTVKTSKTLMKFDQAQNHTNCFYQSANTTEVFTNRIAKGSFLKGDTQINLMLNNAIELEKSHYFHSLSNDLSQWPSFQQEIKLTQRQAFERLNVIYRQLQSVKDDKLAFLALLKEEQATWPYLTEFMTQENSSSEFINRVIWSLNRINSTASVSSLLRVSMSDLPAKSVYRSILTLITSSAEIDRQAIEDLKIHLADSKHSESSSNEQLFLLRSLGALANQRSQIAPLQSQELKQFLYDNVEGAAEQFKASSYESIGALGASIDKQGVQLLINGLNEEHTMVKNSALNALSKIPYQREYSALYVNQLDSEQQSSTREQLIELLGKADKDDSLVKRQLLKIVEGQGAQSHKQKSISSLKKIEFEYNDEEIKILESRLRKETDKSSQAKLASLILKHRRP
jgi:hypothetical protein